MTNFVEDIEESFETNTLRYLLTLNDQIKVKIKNENNNKSKSTYMNKNNFIILTNSLFKISLI